MIDKIKLLFKIPVYKETQTDIHEGKLSELRSLLNNINSRNKISVISSSISKGHTSYGKENNYVLIVTYKVFYLT